MTAQPIGVKGVIIRDGQVLLLQRVRPNGFQHWDLPGGFLEANEDAPAALRREAAEELPGATNIVVGRKLHGFEVARRGLVEFYELSAEIVEVTLSREHVGHQWVDAAGFEALAETHAEWHLNRDYAHAIGLALKQAQS